METLGRQIPPAEYLGDEESAKEFLTYVDKHPEFGFDTESTGRVNWKDSVVFFSIAAGDRRACLPSVLLPVFKPLLEDPEKLCAIHNAKFDMHMVANGGLGVELNCKIIDTLTMSIREDSSRPNHDLKSLVAGGLFHRTDHRFVQYPAFTELFGKKDFLWNLMNPENRDVVKDYASMDAWNHLVVFRELRKRLQSVTASHSGNLWNLFLSLEVPLTRVLYDYERGGFPVDVAHLQSIRRPVTTDMEKLISEICLKLGRPINPVSTPQVSKLLYDELGYKPRKFTSGGRTGNKKASVDEGELLYLISKHDKHEPLLRLILQVRELGKIRGTYIDGFIKLLDPMDRIHPTFKQWGTETTRLSCAKPNMQNIPSRPDKYGLRKAEKAPPGYKVVDWDFDQVEMKIMAALSGDKNMIAIINQGLDIHSKTAAMMYEKAYEAVQGAKDAKDAKKVLDLIQKELLALRDGCKAVGFGIIYEATARKLSEQLGCSLDEATHKQRLWFAQFPEIETYIEKTHRFVQSTGYVTSVLGWRRYFPSGLLKKGDIEENHNWDPEFWHAMRAAVNMTIQGSAADCMKIAMIRVHKDKALRDMGYTPLLTVHDEVVALVPEKYAKDAAKRCQELARDPLEDYGIHLPVHITAGAGVGASWGEAK